MANSRFIDIICELTGTKSPSKIRHEELVKLLREHFEDFREDRCEITETGVIYHAIFESGDDEDGEE